MSENKIKKSVIREDLLAITGDYRKAIILNQFIYWSERVADADKFIERENEIAQSNGEETRELFYGWIYKSADEMADEIMLGLSASQVRKYICSLVEMGYLSKRNNPKYKWDRTLQYRVNLVKIAKDLKKNGYPLSDYKITIPDDELLNARQCAFNDSQNRNQTHSDNEAIPEITTETTINRNYNPETTNINAFNSKELKDGSINAFCNVTKSGGQKTPYISPDTCTEKELANHIRCRVQKFLAKHGENDLEKIDELSRTIEYFYQKYRDVFGESYTILSDKAFEGVVVKFLYPSKLLAENEIYYFDAYKKMIDRYFQTDFGKNSGYGYVGLSLPHFMSDTVRENMAMNTMPLDNMGSAWSL